MSLRINAGTVPRLLCLPVLVCFLASFSGLNPPDARAERLMQEIRANSEAVMQNPSARPGSKLAGAPIHVDPYVHSAGMSHHAHKGRPKGC
jgi:hypothetical protein